MTRLFLAQPSRLCTVALVIALTTGCSILQPAAVEQPYFYSLDGARSEAPASVAKPARTAPTLIINPPHSASGFSSQRIVYVREAHQLEYYAHSEWIDSPTRMLAPLIADAVGSGGAFRAVVRTPSAADGNLRLDTEIVRLQHELGVSPGRVRFTLRATLVDNTTREVLASHEFDASVTATSETPYGGVLAANQAVQSVLEQLARWCAETAGHWQAP
jgi:cholesterol transport system auxiliary component